jgi:hypothetical protein
MLALFVFSSVCYAAPSPNNWGNTDTNPLLKKTIPYYMTTLGMQADGASNGSSMMVSGSTAVPTDAIVVNKYIGATAQAGTLANGVAGQILMIYISQCDTGATFVLTPTTKMGFSTLTFNAVLDQVTLLYVNDTIGWIMINANSVTVA